jgi:NAD(P)-dependent dehydrogenase (short-subunit alcohol dehydrogenase family)
VAKAVGEADDLLAVKLDVTSTEDAEQAVGPPSTASAASTCSSTTRATPMPEVAPFGIHTTIVEPASFRTEVLTRKSVTYAESSLQDYADRTAEQLRWWEEQGGRQPSTPPARPGAAGDRQPGIAAAPFHRRR